MRVFAFLAAVGLGAISLVGCSDGGDDGGTCDSFTLDLECTPQYPPTFDNIFTNSIAPNCAPSGTACHSIDGARGDLVLEDASESYDLLTGSGRDVIAGDACNSALAFRVSTKSVGAQMPPGAPLSPGEQCAIILWIEDGAAR